jgi:hypothetical protein
MFGTISNDLQKLINDLRKLVLFFTQALQAASLCAISQDVAFPNVACLCRAEATLTSRSDR